jgi:hypothetical protein
VKTIMNFGFNKNEEFPELFQEILPSKSWLYSMEWMSEFFTFKQFYALYLLTTCSADLPWVISWEMASFFKCVTSCYVNFHSEYLQHATATSRRPWEQVSAQWGGPFSRQVPKHSLQTPSSEMGTL